MPSAPRLYALLPRNGRKGVVFRRGPSKQVALIAWDLGRDKFELGQWLKGRVYERRCDLSPSGDLLVYFAATWKRTPGSWTALCRPPYFTALALWPKGDTWGGGGMFDAERTLRLNHPANQTALGEGFRLPKDFRVLPLGDHAGRGEDGPLTDLRDARDGWSHVRAAVWQQHNRGAGIWYEAQGGEVHVKRPAGAARGEGVVLERTLDGIHETDGPWYVLRHALVNEASGARAELGRSDWADWDRGDVVFARVGRMYRLRARDVRALRVDAAEEIADFRSMRFESAPPIPEATRWPKR